MNLHYWLAALLLTPGLACAGILWAGPGQDAVDSAQLFWEVTSGGTIMQYVGGPLAMRQGLYLPATAATTAFPAMVDNGAGKQFQVEDFSHIDLNLEALEVTKPGDGHMTDLVTEDVPFLFATTLPLDSWTNLFGVSDHPPGI